MATVTPQGRMIGPSENYQIPEDLCVKCAKRWATWSVLDLASEFDACRLCDACIADVEGVCELLPYAPRTRRPSPSAKR